MPENNRRLCHYPHVQIEKKRENMTNIAGRLPENSRNRFVDRQSKKTVKKTDQKNVFSLICYILIKNLYKVIAASIS